MTTDYIKREDAIEKFAGITLIECDKTTAESPYSLSAAEKFFSDIPSADVVEVVRCKDCIYYEDGECQNGKLPFSDYSDLSSAWLLSKPDDYCSYGERRQT